MGYKKCGIANPECATRRLQPKSPGADGIMYPVHDEKGPR